MGGPSSLMKLAEEVLLWEISSRAGVRGANSRSSSSSKCEALKRGKATEEEKTTDDNQAFF